MTDSVPASSSSTMSVPERYLAAYAAMDLDTMFALQDPAYEFSDAAFPLLKVDEGRAMFEMFKKGRARNKMQVTYRDVAPVEGSQNVYTAVYTCNYIYEGRPVINEIPTTLTLSPESGLIIKQVDAFDFFKWSKQALGVIGYLLGWTPVLPSVVQGKARASLDKFIASKNAKGPAADEAPEAPASSL